MRLLIHASGWFLMSFLFASTGPAQPQSEKTAPREMDRFVSELLKKMTLAEKVGQLNLLSAA